MKHVTHSGIDAYRIGYWTHRWWPRAFTLRQVVTGEQQHFRDPIHRTRKTRNSVRRDAVQRIVRDLGKIRRPHRPWQAEYEDCRWCPRAWTAEGARKRAARDLAYQQATGQWAPWIQRRVRARYGPGAIMGPVSR